MTVAPSEFPDDADKRFRVTRSGDHVAGAHPVEFHRGVPGTNDQLPSVIRPRSPRWIQTQESQDSTVDGRATPQSREWRSRRQRSPPP